MKKTDTRPICTCSAYPFPHKVGGKCKGDVFTEFYYYHDHSLCDSCGCNNGTYCEVSSGQESIKMAECFTERQYYHPGEYLPLHLNLD